MERYQEHDERALQSHCWMVLGNSSLVRLGRPVLNLNFGGLKMGLIKAFYSSMRLSPVVLGMIPRGSRFKPDNAT
jgi:hypothetical protein